MISIEHIIAALRDHQNLAKGNEEAWIAREHKFAAACTELQETKQRLDELATAHQAMAASNQKTIREQQLVLIELRDALAACEKRASIAEAKLQLADALRNRERGLPPDMITVQAEARIADWEGSRGIVTPATAGPDLPLPAEYTPPTTESRMKK